MARVLVVDDEKSIRVTVSAFLEREGHAVTVAEDAAAALAALSGNEFDVVVSDIVLPRVTGVELLRQVRQAAPRVQVVMMTGEPTVDTAGEALRAGAFDYLAKPVSKQDLLKAVANAAALKAALDEQARLADANSRHQHDLERLVAERTQDLLASERRYRQLVVHSPDGIGVLRPDGCFTFANLALAGILGLSPEDLPDRQLWEFVPPEGLAGVRARVEAVVAQQRPQPRAVVELRQAGGRQVAAELVCLPFESEGAAAVQLVVRDITQQRELEQQFLQAQKMEAVGRVAAGVAHDFNNLLTVIGGCAKLAIDGLPAGGQSRLDVQDIIDAAERAGNLTRQLLAFSRRQTLVPRALDPNAVLENVRKMLGRLLGEDMRIEWRLAAGVGTVMADPGQLEQVVLNLAVNARDAMPGGGVLTVETGNADSAEVARAESCAGLADVVPGPYVWIRVRDTGTGMDETVRKRLFEPFFTTKAVGRGTGLGLATVHGIVRQHNGRISVASAPGQGSAFTVYLPAVVGDQAPAMAATGPEALPRGTETILLVDDDLLVRRVTMRMLEPLGYTVLTAGGGDEALDLAAGYHGRIDLLLSDIVMPGLDGPALAQRLTQQTPGLAVLYVSGYEGERLAGHSIRDDDLPILPKPYTGAQLAAAVRERLDRRRP